MLKTEGRLPIEKKPAPSMRPPIHPVEFATRKESQNKEGKAKLDEQKFKQKTQATQGYVSDSPVQNLRDPAKWKKDETKT